MTKWMTLASLNEKDKMRIQYKKKYPTPRSLELDNVQLTFLLASKTKDIQKKILGILNGLIYKLNKVIELK